MKYNKIMYYIVQMVYAMSYKNPHLMFVTFNSITTCVTGGAGTA
jgi:hypothetical protein